MLYSITILFILIKIFKRLKRDLLKVNLKELEIIITYIINSK